LGDGDESGAFVSDGDSSAISSRFMSARPAAYAIPSALTSSEDTRDASSLSAGIEYVCSIRYYRMERQPPSMTGTLPLCNAIWEISDDKY
jgi:hypothetical protein